MKRWLLGAFLLSAIALGLVYTTQAFRLAEPCQLLGC